MGGICSVDGGSMEFKLLKSFLVVAEELSFTRAAEKLFLAQSSVSAQVRGLEDDLGVKLFDRIGRGIVLTDAGKKLMHYARRLEDLSEEMRSDVASSEQLRGSLTVRMPETLASEYMPEVVERYHVNNPDVQVNFINCDDSRLREELNSGSIDLAFLLTDQVLSENVTVSVLGSEPLALVVGAKHPLAGLSEVTTPDLQGESMFYMRVD